MAGAVEDPTMWVSSSWVVLGRLVVSLVAAAKNSRGFPSSAQNRLASFSAKIAFWGPPSP